MESRGSERSQLLTAGGVLSIVGGTFEMIFGAVITALTMKGVIPGVFRPFPPMPWSGERFEIHIMPSFTYLGVPLLVLGIVAIVGGVSALRRKSFGLSLAGAICAVPTFILGILGILSVIFVALSKREFEAHK
jgi:hypothetical protein